jgi:hypothetical protein
MSALSMPRPLATKRTWHPGTALATSSTLDGSSSTNKTCDIDIDGDDGHDDDDGD